MENKVDPKDYVWVVVEIKGLDENFLGLSNDSGEQFIPVCTAKEQAEGLMRQLPQEEGQNRQVEAIHKSQLLKEAAQNGFEVYLVDDKGALLGRLGETAH